MKRYKMPLQTMDDWYIEAKCIAEERPSKL